MRFRRLSWPRFTEYALAPSTGQAAELWLCPHGSRTDEYDPYAETGLVPAFIAINQAWRQRPSVLASGGEDPVREAVLGFAHHYGHLGQTQLGFPPRKVALGGRAVWTIHADELGWVLRHAQNVHLAMTVARARRSKKIRPVQRLVEQLGRRPRVHVRKLGETGRGTAPGASPPRFVPTLADPWACVLKLPSASKVTLSTADALLSQLLEPNLDGVRRRIDLQEAEPVFDFSALMQVIYWQVADALLTKAPIRECQCGTLFFAVDNRQQFCPPPAGVRESRCGRRFRMRERRENDRRRGLAVTPR